ncbi:MAG: cytochrome b/b6 domain-containing protein [Bryobacteraceae bacterium]
MSDAVAPAPADALLPAPGPGQRMIKKHHVAIMLLHWFNAFVWLAELVTGAALIDNNRFGFAPRWYIELLTGVFGARANILRFHIAVGVAWITVLLVYAIFGWRTYLRREVLEREIALDRDDWQWLRIRILRMLDRTHEPLPPQGIYNAGQKLFALSVYTMVPFIAISGLIMALHWGPGALVGWAAAVHFSAVAVVVSGLMIHVYMGAVFPEEKPAFFSMITGLVPEEYAYKHHRKWWEEVRMLEEKRAAGLLDDAQQGSPSRFWKALRQREYWPGYWAALGLGLTLLAAFLLVGQGLGASGGFTRYLAFLIHLVAPGYAASHPYWSNYVQPGAPVLMDFLVFELIGVALGGLVSGWLAGRLRWSTERGSGISVRARWALAFTGGLLSGFGARMARGCTSGLALSGGATLSAGAFLFMLSVFAAGFLGAYLLRRIWL